MKHNTARKIRGGIRLHQRLLTASVCCVCALLVGGKKSDARHLNMLEGVSQLQEITCFQKHLVKCLCFPYIRLRVVRGLCEHNSCVSPRDVIREPKILKSM